MEESKVDTRYLTSEFMERAGAIDVHGKFESASSSLLKAKIQASSDRPKCKFKIFGNIR